MKNYLKNVLSFLTTGGEVHLVKSHELFFLLLKNKIFQPTKILYAPS